MFAPQPLAIVAILSFSALSAAVPQDGNTASSVQHAREWRYRLRDSYTASNFFSSFNFFDQPDPTHGFVSYQPEWSARHRGLVNTDNDKIYMGVDYTTTNPPAPGRASVRLTSKQSYTHGLFIADIAHMPAAACGSWPAFWLFGPNWPNSGEIDIIEGVHLYSSNTITLHTAPGCYINTQGSQPGTSLQHSNCNSGSAFLGCSAHTQAPFGDRFNAGGGGVYAMQWESSGVYVWFWPRDSIPGDIRNGNPDTRNWGTPVVAFNGGNDCNIDAHFRDHNIVFDTTFCGDWAGNVWGSSGCGHRAHSCQAFVAENPAAFKNSYWSVNSVKVYQLRETLFQDQTS